MHAGLSRRDACPVTSLTFPCLRLCYRPAGGQQPDQDGGWSGSGPPRCHGGYRHGVLGLHEESQVRSRRRPDVVIESPK